MNIIIMGPPGSGKGTQSSILKKSLGFKHIIMSDILKKEMKSGGKYSAVIKHSLEKGDLLSSEIIFKIFKKYLQIQSNDKLIFDGIPRTLKQARFLDKTLKELNKDIDLVINFKIDEKVLFSRIENRVVCDDCSASFLKSEVQLSDPCPECNGIVHIRPDDNADTMIKRLQEYKKVNTYITKYYEEETPHRFLNINADRKVNKITAEIKAKIHTLQGVTNKNTA